MATTPEPLDSAIDLLGRLAGNLLVRVALFVLGLSSAFIAGAIWPLGIGYVPLIDKVSLFATISLYFAIFCGLFVVFKNLIQFSFQTSRMVTNSVEKKWKIWATLFLVFMPMVLVWISQTMQGNIDNPVKMYYKIQELQIWKDEIAVSRIKNISITFVLLIISSIAYYITQKRKRIKIVFNNERLSEQRKRFLELPIIMIFVFASLMSYFGGSFWIPAVRNLGSPMDISVNAPYRKVLSGKVLMNAHEGVLVFIGEDKHPRYISWHVITEIRPVGTDQPSSLKY